MSAASVLPKVPCRYVLSSMVLHFPVTGVHIFMYFDVFIYKPTCICVYMYVYMSTDVYIFVNIYIYICIYKMTGMKVPSRPSALLLSSGPRQTSFARSLEDASCKSWAQSHCLKDNMTPKGVFGPKTTSGDSLCTRFCGSPSRGPSVGVPSARAHVCVCKTAPTGPCSSRPGLPP